MPSDGLTIEWVSATTVSVAGELDTSNAARLRHELDSAAGPDLVVDCAGLTFVDSSGLTVLMAVHRARELDGCTMHLQNVNGPPRRMLEIVGLLDALEEPPGSA